jgi:hypothetical protein
MTTSDPAPPGTSAVIAPPRVDDSDDPVVHTLAEALDPPGRGRRWAQRVADVPIEAWVSLAVVAACVIFTFLQLGPDRVLSDTTPAGGDMGAHVWGPAFMRDHLLPSMQLTGWTPDWYAGFPAYQFYMVVPSLAIALLSFVLPYGVAFKLVAISGLLTLPVAAWAFGRLTRLPFPAPPLLAVAATAFLFDRSFSILGGNVASTMAGEFAFSISLSLAVLFLGVVGRGLETGRYRALAAALLALTALCHLIPAIFAGIGALAWFVVSFARRTGVLRRLWWLVGVGAVGVALGAWWLLPFYLRSPYMNDMGWEKRTKYVDLLFQRDTLDAGLTNSPPITWVLVLAVVGVVMSIVWKRRAGGFLVVAAGLLAVAFVVVPQGRLWNARLLPFWYLCLYLLAAIGVAELGRTIATLVARDTSRPSRWITSATAVVGWVVVIVALALPLRALPGGSVAADGSYRWLFLSTTDSSFVSSWARWNFSGYEGKPAYPEYHDIVQTMATLGEQDGCGRAMWEHEEQHDRYGTPMALMLLPFWTDGCIGSMEGLFFESSSTTPYHFLMQDELSTAPSNAQRDLPYSPGAPTAEEFDIGVEHMQLLGVRYYMAISEGMKRLAASNADLTEVASSGPWTVYEVAGSELVTPLDSQPAVLTGVDPAHGWLDAVVPWYEDPEAWSVFLAAGGPDEWQRITEGEAPTITPTAPVAVTDIQTDTDRISFRVSQTGTPVLVKTSYFPNWQVSGAEGPWRISPNLMVVVPTAEEVVLEFGTTPVEWLSWLVTGAGVAGLVALALAGRLTMPPPRPWLRRHTDGDASVGPPPDGGAVPPPETGGGPPPGPPGPASPTAPPGPDAGGVSRDVEMDEVLAALEALTARNRARPSGLGPVGRPAEVPGPSHDASPSSESTLASGSSEASGSSGPAGTPSAS